MTALVAVMFAFNACEEDTTGPENDVPSAPVGLMATSINSTTVHIKWTAPGDLDDALFKDYTVIYYPSNTSADDAPDMTADMAGEPFEITGLDEDKTYTFEVITNYTNGESSTAAKIEWAPAIRFETVDAETIKVYESDATAFGSGISLYDSFLETPEVLTVANIVNWNLGLDTKNSSLNFGSASQLSYTGATTAASAELASVAFTANGLNDVFDSEGMDTRTYTERVEDLTNVSLGAKSGVVFYVRVANGTGFNYAKVYVDGNGGSFLKGTSPNRYVEVTISYQANIDVPYAKQ